MTPATFIYVIGAQRQRAPVKIGISTEPAKRLDTLRTSHHEELFILAQGPGGRSEEQGLHRMFASERMRGEWFKRSNGIINLINLLSSGGLVCDLIAQWRNRERFMQRQVTARAKMVTHNEWDTELTPAEWQKFFEDGHMSAAEYAKTLASLAAAPNITEAEKTDIMMRQHALATQMGWENDEDWQRLLTTP